MEVEILESAPPELYRSRAWNHPFEGVLTVALERHGTGTRMILTEEFAARGWLGRLLEPLFARGAQNRDERYLNNLEGFSERLGLRGLQPVLLWTSPCCHGTVSLDTAGKGYPMTPWSTGQA